MDPITGKSRTNSDVNVRIAAGPGLSAKTAIVVPAVSGIRAVEEFPETGAPPTGISSLTPGTAIKTGGAEVRNRPPGDVPPKTVTGVTYPIVT